MKRIVLIVVVLLTLSFCKKHNDVNQVVTAPTEIQQPIQAIIVDSVNLDTIAIKWVVNKDSIERVNLIKDSIAFRKTCKAINGGYNGFKERYKFWLRARNSLKK